MTKFYFTITILLYLNQITGQNSNFYTDTDNNIYYQKVFKTKDTLSTDKLYTFINNKSSIYNITKQDTVITFEVKKMKVDYKKYGGVFMNTLILLNQSMSATATIDIKPLKYRLTLKNISFLDDSSLYAEGVGSQSSNISRIEDYVLKNKNKQFRTNKTITKGLNYMDLYFTDFFTYQKQSVKAW